MLSNRQGPLNLHRLPTALKSRREDPFKDLSLFLSLCLARLMVWRALRRQANERATRLKRIRLVSRPTTASLNTSFHDRLYCDISEVKGRANSWQPRSSGYWWAGHSEQNKQRTSVSQKKPLWQFFHLMRSPRQLMLLKKFYSFWPWRPPQRLVRPSAM